MKHVFHLFSMATVLALVAMTVGFSPAFAIAAIVVDTTKDSTAIDGHCSLREAIMNINNGNQLHNQTGECSSGSGISQIFFYAGVTTTTMTNMVGKTISLTSTLPALAVNMTISGFSSGPTVTISGAGKHEPFFINQNVTVTLSYLNIINGLSGAGGAIYNSGGTLTVMNSTFSGNKAQNGGAIANAGVGSGRNASLTIANSTFVSNSATYADGGAIINIGRYGGTASANIANSTFTGNKAMEDGGAIAQIADTTSTGLGLLNDTLSGNRAASGGALAVRSGLNGGTISVINTILANSTSGGDCALNSATINWNGYNLIGDGSCLSGGTNNLTGNPLLGPLASYGGATKTMLPASNSPVIGAGVNTFCAASPVNNLDQRGVTRPYYTNCDIGSVEYTPTQYLTNGGFENNTGQFSIPNNWTAVGFNPSTDGADGSHSEAGAYSLTINGQPSKTKTLSQLRLVGSPAAGYFTLSYWVAGNSIPATGTCLVKAALYDGTTLKLTKTINCPLNTYSFGPESISFWTTSAITKAIVTITYSKPSGQVWFDSVSLSQ
jgi:CSLREA domain-containing protein